MWRNGKRSRLKICRRAISLPVRVRPSAPQNRGIPHHDRFRKLVLPRGGPSPGALQPSGDGVALQRWCFFTGDPAVESSPRPMAAFEHSPTALEPERFQPDFSARPSAHSHVAQPQFPRRLQRRHGTDGTSHFEALSRLGYFTLLETRLLQTSVCTEAII